MNAPLYLIIIFRTYLKNEELKKRAVHHVERVPMRNQNYKMAELSYFVHYTFAQYRELAIQRRTLFRIASSRSSGAAYGIRRKMYRYFSII